MAAEIRVDTIKGRSGINTFSFNGDGFSFDQKVGIGTTVASDPVKVTNGGKLSVGIVSSHSLFVSGTSHIKIPAGTTAQRSSSPVAGEIRFNTTLNTYEGYDGDAWGGLGGGTEVDTSVNGTTAVGVGSIAVASHRSASILAQIDQGANYQVGRYLMIHDGTTVTVVEEAAVATGDMLGSFTGSINNSNAELFVTMASSGIATVTTIIDKITI